MEEKLVYIVLLNYNSYQLTIDCVNSLRKIKYNNFKVVIVDNASSDESEEVFRRDLENCIILQSGSNKGFSGGNNIGIKYALQNNAEFVLLLNNDTLVEVNFLITMLESFNKDNVGIVGCKIMYYPEKDKIWFGGGAIDWFKYIALHTAQNEKDLGQRDSEKEISFMTGCCMLIHKDVFNKVGFLPEEYFMYYEDVDFCAQTIEHGYKIIYNPQAVIYHKVSVSTGGEESPFAIQWNTRNRIIFMRKYKYKNSTLNYFNAKVFFYLSRFIRYLLYLKKDKNKAKALLKGLIEGYKIKR